MTKIIGVDPGLSGAIAIIDAKTTSIVDLHDMPIIEYKRKKNQIDLYTLASIVDAHAKQTKMAIVEEVGAMPKQGVVSTFRFGYVTGIVVGVLSANYISITQIKPSVWKPALGLSRDKEDSRVLASKLYPKEVHRWARKKDDGRAEALLLAWFGRKFL